MQYKRSHEILIIRKERKTDKYGVVSKQWMGSKSGRIGEIVLITRRNTCKQQTHNPTSFTISYVLVVTAFHSSFVQASFFMNLLSLLFLSSLYCYSITAATHEIFLRQDSTFLTISILLRLR